MTDQLTPEDESNAVHNADAILRAALSGQPLPGNAFNPAPDDGTVAPDETTAAMLRRNVERCQRQVANAEANAESARRMAEAAAASRITGVQPLIEALTAAVGAYIAVAMASMAEGKACADLADSYERRQ